MQLHTFAGCSGWDRKSVHRALRWIFGTNKFRLWHGVTLEDFYRRYDGDCWVWVRTRLGFHLLEVTDDGGGYTGLRLADPSELPPPPPPAPAVNTDTKVFRVEG